MEMPSYILGIDLGTSSLKLVVYTDTMDPVTSISQKYAVGKGQDIDASHWWDAFMNALSALKKQIPLSRICCISFSGYNAFAPVDRDLNPTAPSILYYHTGPSELMRRLYTERERDLVFERTCVNMFGTGTLGPAMRWLKETSREAYDRTDCFLNSSGYLAARLTGQKVLDASRASLSALHDPRPEELAWDEEMCRLLEIDRARLPLIRQCWEEAGTVSSEAAALTGLPEGTAVIAGSVDSLCASIGNGIMDESRFLDIGGSAGGLATASSRPHPDKKIYTMRYAFPGLWFVNAPLLSSARLFDWFTQNLAPGWDFPDFMKAVDETAPFCGGVLFLPFVGGARYPYWTTEIDGHFLNFKPDTRIQHMARAVVEGLGCAYRSILDDLVQLGLRKPECIVAAGGDTRFETWVRVRAEFTRTPYHLNDTHEVSGKGAALLGAYHLGSVPDPALWLKKASAGEREILPSPEKADHYEAYYRSYQEACRKLYAGIT